MAARTARDAARDGAPDGERQGETPRALRLGLFLAGKPLEERVLRRPQDVVVGTEAGSTFIVPPVRGLPPRFAMFTAAGPSPNAGWALQFTEDMDGLLVKGDDTLSLQDLLAEGAEPRGDRFRVALHSSARGEVRIGNLKILFQLITPPAVVPRPTLPLSLRPSLRQSVDQRLLRIAAGSFAVHFLFVMYLRAMERPKQPDIEELPDRFVKMLVPKKVEPPKPAPTPVKPEDKKPEDKKPEDAKKTAQPSDKAPAEVKKEDPAAAAARAAAERLKMEQAVKSMGVLKMLTAKGPDGPLADALKNGGNDGDPDKVFREVGGVGPVTGEAGLGSARGGEGTGESKSGSALVASGPTEGLGTGEKTEKKVRAVVQESAPQDLDPVDLDPQAVAAKIRQYRGALVACYEAALKRNSTLSGKITLRFSVNSLGKVSHVEIEVDTMHDDDFAKCIVDRASTWRFPPPKSGSGDVQFAYPFIFQSAK